MTTVLMRLSKRARKRVLYRAACGWRTVGVWQKRFALVLLEGRVVGLEECGGFTLSFAHWEATT